MNVRNMDLASRIRRYYSCVDAGDLAGLLGIFSDDIVYCRPGYPPLVGRDELAVFYSEQRVIESGSHRVDSVLVQGKSAAVRGEFSGRLKDGSCVQLKFADFFVASDDGEIRRRDTFFFTPMV